MACLSLVVTRRKGGSRIYGNHQPPPWEKEDHQYRSSSHRQPTSKPLNPTLYTPRLPVPANRTRPNVTTLFPNFGVGGTKAFRGNRREERKKKPTQKSRTPPISHAPCHATKPKLLHVHAVRPFHARPSSQCSGGYSVRTPSKSILIPNTRPCRKKKKILQRQS